MNLARAARICSAQPFLVAMAASLALAACVACARRSPARDPAGAGLLTQGAVIADSASPDLVTAEWQSLFDGTTLAGWHGFKTPGRTPAGWQALGDAITRVAEGDDLVTDRTFANFELELEWQIARGGNSGIIYRIDPTARVTYESGPEMQVLDDAENDEGTSGLTSAGSVYGLYPAKLGLTKPAGQWNAVRIIARGAHVEHWLNGSRVATYELGSTDWNTRVAETKFKEWPGFGQATRGFIALQDHGARVAYRNIRIRELP